MSWTYSVDGLDVTLHWEGNDIITESSTSDHVKRDLSGVSVNPNLRNMAYRAIKQTENNWKSAEATRKAALAGLGQFEEIEP